MESRERRNPARSTGDPSGVAEILEPAPAALKSFDVLKGHDFSRAAKAHTNEGALAPEVLLQMTADSCHVSQF